MKDAKGHGSNPRGGAQASPWVQSGVGSAQLFYRPDRKPSPAEVIAAQHGIQTGHLRGMPAYKVQK